MRTTLSYLDPPVTGDRLITRNGSIFHLAPQGHEGVKEFLKNVPTCLDDSDATVRLWYDVFCDYCATYGIFVQPYFCFRHNANSTTGFTIGDDTDLIKYDVPKKFSVQERHWSLTIYNTLSQSKIFPAGSSMKNAVTHNYSKGYDALRAIIAPRHLLNV